METFKLISYEDFDKPIADGLVSLARKWEKEEEKGEEEEAQEVGHGEL